ncbi:MAG: hypothetical protein CMJ48_14085 [Planctomycetaceae bacterium]|nr:hypothetical protein [Planctomycetaceae bacterium]
MFFARRPLLECHPKLEDSQQLYPMNRRRHALDMISNCQFLGLTNGALRPKRTPEFLAVVFERRHRPFRRPV